MMQLLKFSLPSSNITIPNLSPSDHVFAYPSETRKCNSFDHPPKSAVGLYGLKSSSVLHRSCLNYSALRVHSEMAQHDDGFYMRRSVELARKAIGHTSPNPMVGCVIVKDGNIVGEGFHPKAGQPHAEVFALRDAGELAENATAYVSLEPCNHYGRTPPCTEALLKAKVKKVVVGMVDPNPIVASKGLEKLKAAGVEVTVGVEEELCKNLLEAYTHRMLTGKPFVTLRYSMSINGHVLDQLGEGASTSGGYYSKLMQENDAVIISSTSLNQKLSLPISEEPEANQPLRIIVSRNSDFRFEALEDKSKTIIFSDKEHARETGSAENGIETVFLDELKLNDILDHCYRQGMCSVVLDLRGNLDDYEHLLKDKGLVQKVVVEVLPIWNNESSGVAAQRSLTSLVKGIGVQNMTARSSDKSIILESRVLN